MRERERMLIETSNQNMIEKKIIKNLTLELYNKDIYEILHYLISKRSSQNTNNLL